MVKGRSNDQGNFLKISKILWNGKEFMVFIPTGEGASGWVSMAYVLCHSLGGGGIPVTFPEFASKYVTNNSGLSPVRDMPMNIEVTHRERDWAIYVSRPVEGMGEEDWFRSVLCI